MIFRLMLMMLPMLAAANQQAMPVKTTPIVRGEVNPLQLFVGTLYYDRQSKLASEAEGAVRTLAFTEGQQVRKGDVLLALDSRILEADVAAQRATLKALEADLERQKRELKRSKTLFDRKSISESDYERVFYATEATEAQKAAAQSRLQSLTIQLEKTQIAAPYDAVVATREVDLGEWVGKGATVATLVDTNSIEARLNIPARLIDTLRKAERFEASIEGQPLHATLKSIIPVADAATRTFPVELRIPDGKGLIEGMRIEVQVPTLKKQTGLMVPRDAVIKRFGQNVVFFVTDGIAKMMPVQVIGYDGDRAAIAAAALAEGMRVVVKGNERIFPDMPVMELPKGN